MKKLCIAFLSIFLIGFLPNTIYSQSQYLVAKLDDANVQMGPPGFTSNQFINDILNAHEVRDYGSVFECIRNDYYHFYLDGDINSLEQALAGYYTDFSKHSYGEAYNSVPCSPCSPFNYTLGDPHSQNEYVVEYTNAKCAWGITTGKPEVKIAVLDLNFDPNYNDKNIHGTIHDFVPIPDPVPPNHRCFHGTSVISVIGSELDNGENISGVCSNCTTDGYLWDDLDCRIGDFFSPLCGIYSSYDVINISAGVAGGSLICPPLDESQQLRIEILEKITESGTVVVFAAGNDPENKAHCLWANIPGVINVSGSNFQNGTLKVNQGHAHNQWVDLCAPSSQVPVVFHSLDPNRIDVDGNEMTMQTGTSYAAPQVAGTAGLMLSLNHCLTPGSVEEIIKETTIPHNQDDLDAYPGEIGAGMLDIFASVNAARGEFAPITKDRTWKFDHYLTCDLEITNGATLTIDGANVFIGPDVKIIVEKGGIENGVSFDGSKLILKNGARLTSIEENCIEPELNPNWTEEFWQGIEIEGYDSVMAEHPGQASVEVQKDCIIENAKIAVTVFGGANIISEEANFINNQVAIEFFEYYDDNLSNFHLTTFEVNNDLMSTNNWDSHNAHIRMSLVSGINFEGCNFINTHPTMEYPQRGYGIKSIDASFNVISSGSPSSPPYTRSNFNGFNYGIQAGNTTSLPVININDCEFGQNTVGVNVNNCNNLDLINSDFEINPRTGLSVVSHMWGAIVTNSSGYVIGNNKFDHDYGATIDGQDFIGLLVINSGIEDNAVTDNVFTGLENACLATLENRSLFVPNRNGLEYLCNEYNGNIKDINVFEFFYSFNQNQGVRTKQGDADDHSTENCFINASNTAYNFENLISELIGYYHKEENCQTPTLINNLDPEIETRQGPCGLIPHPMVEDPDPDPPCSSGFDDPNCLGHYLNIINQKESEWNNFFALLDGGNTSNVLNAIHNQPAQNVLSLLTGISPYVSSESIIALLDEKDLKFSASEVKDVMLLNPDVLGRKELFERIFSLETWTSAELDELNVALNSTSNRTVLIASIGDIQSEITRMRRSMIDHLLIQDPIDFNRIRNWLEPDNTFTNDLSIVKSYFQEGNHTAGIAKLNAINLNEYIESIDPSEFNELVTLVNIQFNASSQGFIDYWNMSNTDIQTLYTLSQKYYELGGSYAMDILNYYFDAEIHPWDNFIPSSGSTPPQNRIADDQYHKSEKLVYPNPAVGEFIINLSQIESDEYQIILFDNMGRIMYNEKRLNNENVILNASKMQPGIYYLKIIGNSGIELTEKLLKIN